MIMIHQSLTTPNWGMGGAEDQGNLGVAGDTTSVTAGGDVVFTGGTGDYNYALLGNGGRNFDGNHTGNIELNGDGDVRFTAGNESRTYVQLGNGGEESKGNHTGDITVITTGGGVYFQAGMGLDAGSARAYALLGNGGAEADGNHSGNIIVTSTQGLDRGRGVVPCAVIRMKIIPNWVMGACMLARGRMPIHSG